MEQNKERKYWLVVTKKVGTGMKTRGVLCCALGVLFFLSSCSLNTKEEQNKPDPVNKAGNFQLVGEDFTDSYNKARGFYKIEAPQSGNYANIYLYNYETRQQEIVCKKQDCSHDTDTCTAYIQSECGINCFSTDKYLFMCYSGNPGEQIGVDPPAKLVRMNLDGTEPKTLLEYRDRELYIRHVFANEDDLYFQDSYGFVRLNVETGEKEILVKTNLSGEVFLKEKYVYLNLNKSMFQGEFLFFVSDYDTFTSVYALSPKGGDLRHLKTWPYIVSTPGSFNAEGMGYYADHITGEIHSFNLATLEDTLFTDAFATPERTELIVEEYPPTIEGEEPHRITIHPVEYWQLADYGEWLGVTIQAYKGGQGLTYPEEAYFCNKESGEIRKLTLEDFYYGQSRPIQILENTEKGLLVIEETKLVNKTYIGYGNQVCSFEAEREVYAFISVKDFINGKPKFVTIQPYDFEQQKKS